MVEVVFTTIRGRVGNVEGLCGYEGGDVLVFFGVEGCLVGFAGLGGWWGHFCGLALVVWVGGLVMRERLLVDGSMDACSAWMDGVDFYAKICAYIRVGARGALN